MIGSRKPRHPGFVAKDRATGAGGGGVYREHCDLVAALDQKRPERIDGGGFAHPRRAGDADPDGLAGVGQKRLHQIARCRLMIAAPAFDQRDRPSQRRPVACAQLFGYGFDVKGGIFRRGHVLLYNGDAREARGSAGSAIWEDKLTHRRLMMSTAKSGNDGEVVLVHGYSAHFLWSLRKQGPITPGRG